MKNKKGFTLIELMIVVAIIAILAMIAVPMYQKYIERARNNAAQSTLQQLATAQIARSTTGDDFVFEDSVDNLDLLVDSGFRPDSNVGIQIAEVTVTDTQGNTTDTFIMFAAHRAAGSTVYVYDNAGASGVVAWADASSIATDAFSGLQIYQMMADGSGVEEGNAVTTDSAGKVTVTASTT